MHGKQFDAIVHMGDHAYFYGDANGTRSDSYLTGYSPVLSRIPWVPVVGNHEGYDSFFLYFNETDGENSAVDPATAVPHPMTSLLRTSTALYGASSLGLGSGGGGGDASGDRAAGERSQSGGGGSGTPRWFSLQIGLVHLAAIDCMVGWASPADAANNNQTDPDTR